MAALLSPPAWYRQQTNKPNETTQLDAATYSKPQQAPTKFHGRLDVPSRLVITHKPKPKPNT
jgi:hypothetical protein